LLRRTRFSNQIIHEEFDTSKKSDLKDLIYLSDKWREMRFYPSTRLDGMIKRISVEGKKVLIILGYFCLTLN
jgi:hypothetical protein